MRDSVRQLGVQLHGWPTWYSVAVRGRYSVTHRCARGRSSSTARRDRLIHRVVVFCAAERREFTLIGGTVVVVIMGCGVALLNGSTHSIRITNSPGPPSTAAIASRFLTQATFG